MPTTHIDDTLPPEACAMVQALYSRSPASVHDHLAKVAESGAAAFMDRFYVGYGHKSIGDCGTTTVFVEGVSMLAAKALQDSPLYNGQEASTRYQDMAKAEFLLPRMPGMNGSPDESPGWMRVCEVCRGVQEGWRALYAGLLAELKEAIAERHPHDGSGLTAWTKAVAARAFDVARGWLPAGAATNVSWHTTLSHARDHLAQLDANPLHEVRHLARSLRHGLHAKYPSSGFGTEARPATVAEVLVPEGMQYPAHRVFTDHSLFDAAWLQRLAPRLAARPARELLGRGTDALGQLRFGFSLDFGSWRDLQRHRPVLQARGRLEAAHFHGWYLDRIEEYLGADRREAVAGQTHALMDRARAAAGQLEADEGQYLVPMGATVPCLLQGSLRNVAYIAELRSGQTVHPTLRAVAQRFGLALDDLSRTPGFSRADFSADAWSQKRGTQDIVEKA